MVVVARKLKTKPIKIPIAEQAYAELKRQILENEIVSRYYYQAGRIRNSLKHDNFLKEAINVMNSRSEYNKILKNL